MKRSCDVLVLLERTHIATHQKVNKHREFHYHWTKCVTSHKKVIKRRVPLVEGNDVTIDTLIVASSSLVVGAEVGTVWKLVEGIEIATPTSATAKRVFTSVKTTNIPATSKSLGCP